MDFELYVTSEEKIKTYFPQMLIPHIFQELGYPEEILLDTSEVSDSYDIRLRYSQENINYDFGSISYETGKICINPKDLDEETNAILVHAGISLPGRKEVEPYYFADVPRDWLSLEEVLGITNLDFYNQVLENPDACFDIVSE